MEPDGSLPQFTSARHLSVSWASSIQPRPLHPTSWRLSWCTGNQEIINNMNYTTLMNVTHSSLLERYHHLWETYFLHLLGGSRFPQNVFEIQTTRRHNPEDGNLQSHCREKIESYIIMLGFYYDLQLLDCVGHQNITDRTEARSHVDRPHTISTSNEYNRCFQLALSRRKRRGLHRKLFRASTVTISTPKFARLRSF